MKKSSIIKISGIIGIIGCIAVILADIIGIIVDEKHDPIRDTISMLAIGKHAWIQDLGLYVLSVGFLAMAIGLYTWKNSGTRWITGVVILVLISVDLMIIAEHHQYAGSKQETLHQKLVYVLAGLFFILNLVLSRDLVSLHPSLKKMSYWVAGLWIVFAPLLPLIPDGYDGGYERLVCVLLVVWPTVVSYRMITNARGENAPAENKESNLDPPVS